MKRHLKKTEISPAFLRLFLSMIFLMMIILTSPPKVMGQENLLKPLVNFASDLEYQEEPVALVEVYGEGEPLDPEKIVITYAGIDGSGNPYEKTAVAPQDAGTYTVSVVYEGDLNYQKISESKQVTIRPRRLAMEGFFTPGPAGKVYDGTRDSPILSIAGLSHQQILERDKNKVIINFRSSSYLFKDVLTDNKLVLSGLNLSGEKSYNYMIGQRLNSENEIINENREPQDKIKSTDALIDAKIEKRPLGIYLTSGHKPYDGTPNLNQSGFAINQADLVSGEEVEILTDSNFKPWYGFADQKIKDVGSYLVYADEGFLIKGLNETVGDNYRPANLPLYSHLKYEIIATKVIVNPTYIYKYEGEDDPPLTYSVWKFTDQDELRDGLFAGDTLSGSLGRAAGETMGLYDINQGDLNNPNYIILFQNGENKFEILAKDMKAPRRINENDSSSDDQGRGRWDEIISPPALFGGGLILLIIVVGGAFYVRNKMTNFD